MTAPTEIFVMTLNFGCEGHTPPIQAFLCKEDALAAKSLMDAASHCSVDLFAVPVWPAPATRWMDQKPITSEDPPDEATDAA